MTQEALPTMEDVIIPELSEKAEAYEQSKETRLRALGKEVVLKGELIDLMKQHGKSVYRDGNLIVEITQGKDGLKVKHESENGSE